MSGVQEQPTLRGLEQSPIISPSSRRRRGKQVAYGGS